MCSQSPETLVKAGKGSGEGRAELKFYPAFLDSCLHKKWKEVYYSMYTQIVGWRDVGWGGRETL